MREMRQMLHSRSLSRLEVVVPTDLSVGFLNARRRELASLEERTDCRIIFNADSLMKAREFRLVPTFRKGERRKEEKQQPVRPSLLAPLMVEQAKAIKLAKELAAMKADDLERELNSDPVSGEERDTTVAKPAEAKPALRAAEAGANVVAVAPPAPRRAPDLWDEASVLRRMLFSPNTTVVVAPAAQVALATPPPPATSLPRNGRRRRRRR